ncbi:hypothetical protein CSC68_00605 [Pseudoxanthomonas suwonensis]|nr:hypothetical protein CSC68_00605 [Pseudoxanthomonas suwonensis]
MPVVEERSMPIAESNPAAALSFDAAVNRALSRRPADTPLPPRPDASDWDGPVKPADTPRATSASVPEPDPSLPAPDPDAARDAA